MRQRLDFYHLPEDQKQLATRDHDLIKTLHTILKLEKSETFTSDTIRDYGLDRHFADTAHGIGGFCARLKVNKIVVEVGWTRSKRASNHGRQIRKYQFIQQGV